MRFRKKPVEVDAWAVRDLIEANAHNTTLLPDDVVAAKAEGLIEFKEDRILVDTLEGVMVGSGTDWLIRGVKGEFYPCRNDVFEVTYDLVTEMRIGARMHDPTAASTIKEEV